MGREYYLSCNFLEAEAARSSTTSMAASMLRKISSVEGATDGVVCTGTDSSTEDIVKQFYDFSEEKMLKV